MTSLADCPIEIQGLNGAWTAGHADTRPVGPCALDADGLPVMADLSVVYDDLDDQRAVLDSQRQTHKAGEVVVRAVGHLPFGGEPSIVWNARHTDRLIRFTVDLTMPRGQVLRESLQVGSLRLPGDWTQLRAVDLDGAEHTVDLADAAITEWEHPGMLPVMVATRADGLQLELGLGGDLWRWAQGVYPQAENRGVTRLTRGADGWQLSRHVSLAQADVEPEYRKYRFTHYLAWLPAGESAAATPDAVVARWRPNGDLALRQLGDLAPGQALIIDPLTLDCPEPLFRDQEPKGLCLSSSRVQKRLKRVVRQLANLEQQNFPVRFRLSVGQCRVGGHIDRGGQRLHSDVGGLMDLAGWIRGQLGPERDLAIADAPDDRPLWHALFRPPLVTD